MGRERIEASMVTLTNILVPTDFSENSTQALEFAHYLAMSSKASLHVLHIVEPIITSGLGRENLIKEKFIHFKLLEAEEELRRFINKISPQGIRIIEALKQGKPHEQILQYSTQNHIDLIVIASHGCTGLSHLITGNVANKVIRFSEVPTICIKTNNLVLQKENSVHKNNFAENWFG